METFEEQIKLAHRLNASFSIAFIDLDRFKQLNDTRGHKEGDAALKMAGTILLNATRSTCRIPSDHIPIRSWPLFLARELMRDLIETLKAEQST